ncbi:hypothetical protein QJS04_geneDACA017254 [Acorus gramineus]|uniref:Uncharacterized protein n=1 Tax=Acorus gramineus TaxID=55184 RepID=A0AAV9A1U8_ACOGR|nr:hypothetical protein QJS04_geneDACA017254 [Acorus gramineus]
MGGGGFKRTSSDINSDQQTAKMTDGPKLLTRKPPKGQLKRKAKESSSSEALKSPPLPTRPMDPTSASAPPPPPKESFARRFKFVWPVLLTVNLAIGAYLFLRTRNKDSGVEDSGKAVGEVSASPDEKTTSSTDVPQKKEVPVADNIAVPLSVTRPAKVSETASQDEWSGALKWMLEEKRKVKPANPVEMKKIDEEKALLKQYISL